MAESSACLSPAQPPVGPRARAFRFRRDDLAELLGEQFLMVATSAEDVLEDVRGETVVEEIGGPFVVDDAREEEVDAVLEPGRRRGTKEGCRHARKAHSCRRR